MVSVRAGARWDQARWDAAEARLDLDAMGEDPTELDAMRSLTALLTAGHMPPELEEEVRQALARGSVGKGVN